MPFDSSGFTAKIIEPLGIRSGRHLPTGINRIASRNNRVLPRAWYDAPVLRKRALRAIAGRSLSPAKVPTTTEKAPITFIHISKNAGTEIGRRLREANDILGEEIFRKSHHDFKLRRLPKGHDYFFSIRNPVDRYFSAFYSRKRKGRPRYDSEWTAHEALAFEAFDHANDLAEALFSEGQNGKQAFCAMKSISHVARNQVDNFVRTGNFLTVRPPLAIIRVSNLESDLARFMSNLGIDPVVLAPDPVKSHQNDYSKVPELTDLARKNLAKWYVQDFELFRVCEEWIEAQ